MTCGSKISLVYIFFIHCHNLKQRKIKIELAFLEILNREKNLSHIIIILAKQGKISCRFEISFQSDSYVACTECCHGEMVVL